MRPQELAERALRAAQGLDGAVAIVTARSRADVRWARTTLTTNGESRQVDLTVIGFRRVQGGVATATLSRSHPDEAGVQELVASVRAALESASPAEDAMPLIDGDQEGVVGWDEPAPLTSSASLSPLTAPLGELFRSCVADDVELFGYAEHDLTTTWVASTTGLRRIHVQPSARLEMTAKSHGRSRSAWWGLASDDFEGIDLTAGERDLRRGLGWQERRIDIDPGRHRALLTPGAFGDLMVDLWWSMNAREAVEGRSVFSAPGGGTRLGERLSTRALTLRSDPFDAEIPAADFVATAASSDMSSVFDNGMSTNRVDWLDRGTLHNLHCPRWLAQREHLPMAAGADTLRMEDAAGVGGLDDVLGRTQNALLVTCVWYNRLVDPQTLLLTGLTRDGVYVVRGGEVVGATSNFRFNESPVAILGRVSDSGVTQRTQPREMGDYAARVAMPPVVVEDFHFSTVSDAL